MGSKILLFWVGSRRFGARCPCSGHQVVERTDIPEELHLTLLFLGPPGGPQMTVLLILMIPGTGRLVVI